MKLVYQALLARKKMVACFAAVILSALFVCLSGTNTFAVKAASFDTIVERAKVADLAKCHDFFADEVVASSISKPHDILTVNKNSEANLALPNGTINGDQLFNCYKLMDDYLGYSFNPNSLSEQEAFLKKMGYKADNSTYDQTCYTYTFKQNGTDYGEAGAPESIIRVCAITKGSSIYKVDTQVEKGGGSGVTIYDNGGNQLMVEVPGSSNPYPVDYDPNNVNGLFSAIDSVLDKQLNSVGYTYSKESGGGMAELPAEDSGVFKKGPLITNTTTVFTEDERVGLLVHYFEQYGNISCNWVEGSEKITINSQEYYVAKKPDAPNTFYVVNGTSWYTTMTWGEVVAALGEVQIDGMANCEGVEPPGIGETEATDEDACFNGANSLGWIVCPIISALRSTLETIYDQIITPFLEINVSAFNMDGNGVYKGWQTFQGFANIAFVILLLVVIFSQVTGIGIDNLGIKRILPKLIVAAVLINLSYIICQLLVDVSNITGYGLRSLFESIQISGQSAGTGQGILTTAISGAVAAGAVAGAVATAGMWAPFIILPLLLSLVTMLISVLFMFILLGVRQAGVIILVVVSPLAFVLYMLPNTKPLFTKWWKALTGLLLLFPICGAMIGGSALAGRILASTSTDFGPNLIAALLTVVPFFFVPTLLRGSFSALGNIGAKISGFGQRMAGGIGKVASEGVKRTSAFKNVQANAKDREELRSRVAERRRLEGITSRIGNIQAGMRTPEQQLQYARAQAALEKMNDEDLFSNPELIQSEAASKRFNRQVEAMKSKNVASGMVNRIGEVDGKTFTGSGGQFTQNTLAYSLYNAADDVERYAITSQLMASGHHGAEALHQVMQALGNDGNTAALATIAAAAKGDNKLGDLKSGARSTYDYINDLAEGKIKAGAVGSGGNVSDYVSGAGGARQVSFGGMSEQQLVNTDKEELRRYEQVIAQKRARGEELNDNEKKLVAQATAAWNNERIRGSAKKDIQDTISRIAFGTVRTPGKSDSGKAGEGENFDVRGGEDDDNGPAPTSPSGGSPAPSGGGGGGTPAPSGDSGSTSSGDSSTSSDSESFAGSSSRVDDIEQARRQAIAENTVRDASREGSAIGTFNMARGAKRTPSNRANDYYGPREEPKSNIPDLKLTSFDQLHSNDDK